MFKQKQIFVALCALSGAALGQQSNNDAPLEEVVVTSERKVYANTNTTQAMLDQQNPITSVLATVNKLPGVNITEGDSFGFDDWSTTINVRGFQNSLSEQQVGITIDGLPNGESNYGGGSKANRFIDSANNYGVEVSQGTADISSRSLEALGGTLNFRTRDPREESNINVGFSLGDHDSRRYALSVDTGLIFNGSTKAFISASHQQASDWITGSAENERDHLAVKFVSQIGDASVTGYLSVDEVHEDNYQRITAAEFSADPTTDRLIGDWTGIPYVDQVHRQSWSTLRDNTFAYLKMDHDVSDRLNLKAAVYHHDNEGRGDWVPPQIVDVFDDQGGPESEVLGGSTVFGGPLLGAIYFVNSQGIALNPREGCQSSITFPYGGAGPEYDPACYSEDAIAVQSYRHTHYQKSRTGITADFEFDTQIAGVDNQLRGGVWYEDQTREEYRDWHRIFDTRVGPTFDEQPYFVQYDRDYPREVVNFYIEDSLSLGEVTATLGVRQFDVELERQDKFDAANNRTLNSDSDLLFAGGLRWDTPIDGVELFAGYAQNFKALNDLILEREAADASTIEPETSENIELGLRYRNDNFDGSVTLFSNTFENRVEFFSAQTAGNIPNYTIGTDGRFDNVGGIETDGIEASGTLQLSESLSAYGAFTYLDSIYVGTGLGQEADDALGVFAGNKVVNTPETSFVLSLDWADEVYRAGISGKYVDDRYIDRANTSLAESYVITDLYLGMQAGGISDLLQGLDLSLVVNNLFDESYLGGISGFGAWIGSPRTAVFSVSADF